jgi:hypothetical protein
VRRVGMDTVDVNNLIPIDHNLVPLFRVGETMPPGLRSAASAFVEACPVRLAIPQ